MIQLNTSELRLLMNVLINESKRVNELAASDVERDELDRLDYYDSKLTSMNVLMNKIRKELRR